MYAKDVIKRYYEADMFLKIIYVLLKNRGMYRLNCGAKIKDGLL